ncbi:MAG: FAD-dependent oxidoreductase [Chloroflexi bacterium]|nr:FAD-dependent oxidoreductase [Chloroflexota bacterium]
MPEQYDVVVVGGGLAGLTAGLFACRYGLKTALVEANIPGGQIINAEKIENFPGFPQGIAGAELGPQVQEQAMQYGLDLKLAEAARLVLRDPYRVVETSEGPIQCKAVVVAAGSSLRKLGIPGEEEFYGKGVSHCATCDGPFFANEVVGVVGGGDSALDEALSLTQFASRVLLFHRRDTLRAQKVLQGRVLAHPKVEVRWNTRVTAIHGDSQVRSVAVQDTRSGETSQAPLSGMFIYVGLEPNTRWLQGAVPLDNSGHIPVDLWMQTPVAGVFAAGDIRQHSAAQLVTVAGDGATAAIAAYRYVSGRTWG